MLLLYALLSDEERTQREEHEQPVLYLPPWLVSLCHMMTEGDICAVLVAF